MRGAEKVAIVDSVQYRMDYAKKWLPEVQTIDFSKVQVSYPATPVTASRVVGMCCSACIPSASIADAACMRSAPRVLTQAGGGFLSCRNILHSPARESY